MIEEIILNKYIQLKGKKAGDGFEVRQVRDLVITEFTDDFWMIVACDSDGGIGPKKLDTVYSSGYDLGRLGARVPIMEILASGAVPILVVDVLSVEMEPTGKEIIRGVKDEAIDAGMNSNIIITGSTEDNVATIQTGMGVVIIGLIQKKDFRPGNSIAGDSVVCIGIPKSAPEFKVVFSDSEIADPRTINELGKLDFIHDILPVGSKGISHEFAELAKSANLFPNYNQNLNVDVSKSGGPSTCCLVSLPKNMIDVLREKIEKPMFTIGELRNRI
ncbi:MAG: hypothetical protein NTX65_04220 [Ignavibacteriales bacterium]|nr:hypothetical protein [Ignavibacteriales bacterium]